MNPVWVLFETASESVSHHFTDKKSISIRRSQDTRVLKNIHLFCLIHWFDVEVIGVDLALYTVKKRESFH